jgi:hypothetical protein
MSLRIEHIIAQFKDRKSQATSGLMEQRKFPLTISGLGQGMRELS